MTDEITLKIEGMTCGHCKMHVTKALDSLDGVSKADVSLENNSAKVNYNSNSVSIETMIKAVEEAGYKASV